MFRLPGGYRLIVGRDIEERRVLARVIRSAMLWGLGVMALFGIGGGYWVSRKLLARIDAVTATTHTIMRGDLAERLPVSGSGDELDRLSESLNLMLDRIEQLMAGLREVSDNIAHDLKTPLSRLRNRVEATLQRALWRNLLPRGDGANHRGSRRADQNVQRAAVHRAGSRRAPAAKQKEPLELSEVVRDVAELYEPAAEERGIALRAEAPEPVYTRADRQLLGQAIANLVDNAIKYGTPKSRRSGARSRKSSSAPSEVTAWPKSP